MKKFLQFFCLLCILISFLNIFGPNPFQNKTKNIVLQGDLKINQEGVPFSGCWVITDYKMSDLYSLDTRELKKTLGTTAIVNKNNVLLLGNVYKNPYFKTKIVKPEEYFNKYNISPSDLGIDNNKKVKVIDIIGKNNC